MQIPITKKLNIIIIIIIIIYARAALNKMVQETVTNMQQNMIRGSQRNDSVKHLRLRPRVEVLGPFSLKELRAERSCGGK